MQTNVKFKPVPNKKTYAGLPREWAKDELCASIDAWLDDPDIRGTSMVCPEIIDSENPEEKVPHGWSKYQNTHKETWRPLLKALVAYDDINDFLQSDAVRSFFTEKAVSAELNTFVRNHEEEKTLTPEALSKKRFVLLKSELTHACEALIPLLGKSGKSSKHHDFAEALQYHLIRKWCQLRDRDGQSLALQRAKKVGPQEVTRNNALYLGKPAPNLLHDLVIASEHGTIRQCAFGSGGNLSSESETANEARWQASRTLFTYELERNVRLDTLLRTVIKNGQKNQKGAQALTVNDEYVERTKRICKHNLISLGFKSSEASQLLENTAISSVQMDEETLRSLSNSAAKRLEKESIKVVERKFKRVAYAMHPGIKPKAAEKMTLQSLLDSRPSNASDIKLTKGEMLAYISANIEPAARRILQHMHSGHISIDTPSSDAEITGHIHLRDEKTNAPGRQLEYEDIWDAIRRLDLKEATVILARNQDVQLRVIGKSLGLTRERIRQIESDASRKIKAHVNDVPPYTNGQINPDTAAIDALITKYCNHEPIVTSEAKERQIPEKIGRKITGKNLDVKLEPPTENFWVAKPGAECEDAIHRTVTTSPVPTQWLHFDAVAKLVGATTEATETQLQKLWDEIAGIQTDTDTVTYGNRTLRLSRSPENDALMLDSKYIPALQDAVSNHTPELAEMLEANKKQDEKTSAAKNGNHVLEVNPLFPESRMMPKELRRTAKKSCLKH